MKTALVGGGILAAAYVAAGMLYAKRRRQGVINGTLPRVGNVEAVAVWPYVMFNDRKAEHAKNGGAALKDVAQAALDGTTSVAIRR